MKIAESVADLIGNTPLLRLRRIGGGLAADIVLKMECLNPLSSVKDRTCLAIILDAERRGLLSPGAAVIEPTSGNAGIALASLCASRGYRLILTMPDTVGPERRDLLAAFGAEVVMTDPALGMRGAMEAAEELLETTPGAFMPQQFNNPANPEAHRKETAEEIWRDARGKVSALVCGVGTGGSFTGISEVFKQRVKGFLSIAVEPADSPVLSGGTASPHRLLGLGPGFVPRVLKRELIDEVIQVRDEDAGQTVRRLAREEGILAGISTGANVWAALQVAARPAMAGKTIVTLAPDGGQRYAGSWVFSPPPAGA
jgi:cysteine synthase